ncbi:acyltransferase [Sphingomonas humi]|uniref:Acyltransferase n=1 Tax=Sphingomonas humi TaxID=335630 RepID=A0ABP7S060_9SPHN
MIAPLTSLRFFAASLVVAQHYFGFSAGHAGVSFFFVLSGFVLAMNYEGKVSTPEERRLFWWKRVARIYPTHLLTALLVIPISSALFTLPLNLALLQSWVPTRTAYFSLNAPSWSISDEAFFYAVFPFLLPLVTRFRVAIWAALLLAAASAFAIFLPQPLDDQPTHFLFYIFPPTRLLEFAIGISLAKLRADGPPLGTGSELAAILLAAGSLAAFEFGVPGSFGSALLFIPAAIALVAVFARSSGLFARLLSAQPLILLGDASFMLYMLHLPLIRYLRFLPEWLVAMLAVVLSIALFWWFEKPAQKMILRYARRRGERSRPPVTTAPEGPSQAASGGSS